MNSSMTTSSRVARRIAGAVLSAGIAATGVFLSPAAATADEVKPLGSASSSTNFTNGATLTANAWWQQFFTSCFDFETSAVISGGHAPVSGNDWVRNATTFEGRGVNASLTGFGHSGRAVTGTWTNSNGSRGSYLGGEICANVWTLYVEVTTEATAFYNGQTRSATASSW